MNILGFSTGHDAAVALIRGDDIAFASHAERYSNIKHDGKINSKLIADCIFNYGYPNKVAYYERPWLKKTRQLYSGQYSELTSGWSARNMLTESVPWSNLDKLPLTTHSHHLSHAAAGFQTSPFSEATVVVIDAIGEWDTISIFSATYKNGKAQYKRLWRKLYPHSIGLMYSAFTKEAGLTPNEEEYILMGMAGWSKPTKSYRRYLLDNWLFNNTNMKHNFHIGLPMSPSEFLDETISDIELARYAQDTVERMLHDVIYKAFKLTTSKNLVYMGGVALNCVANVNLNTYFPNVWIMPNPGDAGSSIGAAALVHGGQLNWQGPYLGHNITGPYPVANVLSELVTNKIVGVASGRAEFGPRALGNRSLLADPRGADIKDAVNDIKRRQKFRPFAPVILEEYVDEYFALPRNVTSSPYMQTVAQCLHPEKFPAIIHIDGTSRVQTVGKDCPSGIRQLLEAWNVWTGCPMLLNTSLNIRGEPMVNDRNDADRFETLYGVKVIS